MVDNDSLTRSEAVGRAAVTATLADGGRAQVIHQADLDRLAAGAGPPERRSLEIAALEQGIVPTRYLRNMGTFGPTGQLRLLAARVGVAGVGGLGGHVAELLARAGVGELVLVDPDVASDDNLNRQLMVTVANLGRPKVELAAERLAEVNPAVSVSGHRAAGDCESFAAYYRGSAAVVDCLDNLPSRWALLAAARNLGLPMVHGAIAGLSGQVTCFFPGDPGLELLYGPEENAPERGIEVRVGNPAPTPALVAACQAQEVIKLLTGVGAPLRRRLLLFDGLAPYVAMVEL